MPFNPSNPISGTVKVSQAQSLDEYHITDIAITKPVGGAPVLHIVWAMGATVDGAFAEAKRDQHAFYGTADLLAKMVAETNDGESFYDAIKRACYELLEEGGFIPEGSIS